MPVIPGGISKCLVNNRTARPGEFSRGKISTLCVRGFLDRQRPEDTVEKLEVLSHKNNRRNRLHSFRALVKLETKHSKSANSVSFGRFWKDVKCSGAVAQLGERQNRTLEVGGSTPLCSTKCPFKSM